MIWICTNAKISWDAISAVGTGAAALIALVIWLVDRREKRRKTKASGRLAAQLVYTETVPVLANLATMKNRLYARPDGLQAEWDSEIVSDLETTFSFYSAMAPKVRSERLERMLESNDSLTPELSQAVADMLAAITIAAGYSLVVFSMNDVAAHQNLNSLRASFTHAFEATQRAQSAALDRSREGRIAPCGMQARAEKEVDLSAAKTAPSS